MILRVGHMIIMKMSNWMFRLICYLVLSIAFGIACVHAQLAPTGVGLGGRQPCPPIARSVVGFQSEGYGDASAESYAHVGAKSNSPVCLGDPIMLFGESPSAVAYSWTGPDGFASSAQNPVLPSNPLSAGVYVLTVELTSGCIASAKTEVTVNDCDLTLDIKVFMEGYYIGSGLMQPVLANEGVTPDPTLTDTVTVELREAGDPAIVVGSSKTLIGTEGTGTAVFPETAPAEYWIVLKHRNSIQTWSALPVLLPGTYDFTTSPLQAFGGNIVDVYGEGIYAIYTGDVNQDEFIDIFDFPPYDFDNQNFVSFQYVNTDFNGDGFVDIFDFPVFDHNNQFFIFSIHP